MKSRREFLSRPHTLRRANERQRRGFVLLVVTIVVILLSLAAWSYMNKMSVEQEATMMYGRDVEARMAAESAIEYAAIQIGQLQPVQNNLLESR